MTEIELITKAIRDAYTFVKEQEKTKETNELLINLFKAEILIKNCSIHDVVGQSEQLVCDHDWKSRFSEKRGGWRLCAKCAKEE